MKYILIILLLVGCSKKNFEGTKIVNDEVLMIGDEDSPNGAILHIDENTGIIFDNTYYKYKVQINQ